MMDILYILGPGSTHDDVELRYSLRSVEHFGKNVGRVFICGPELPSFINEDEVIFIHHEDERSAKHHNILAAIEYAVLNSSIGEEFLLSSDDHFYVKETDFDNYPIYVKGELPQKDSDNKYFRSLFQTRIVLTAAGLPCLQFNWHGNTHFFKKEFLMMKNIIDASYLMSEGCEPTSMMLNFKMWKDGLKYVRRSDIKIGKFNSVEDLLSRIGDHECFSISDEALDCGLEYWLKSILPERSKYELEN